MIASMINEFVKKNLPNSSPNLNSLVQKRSSKNFFLTVFRIRKKIRMQNGEQFMFQNI